MENKYQQVNLKDAMIDVINNPDNNSIYHVWDRRNDEMISVSELSVCDWDFEDYIVFKMVE